MKATEYLELSDGKAHKFYEVEIRGSSVLLRWGRIGAEPQEHALIADNPTHARRLARRRLAEKKRKGYRPAVKGATQPQAPRPPDDPRQLALELPTPRRRRRRQEGANAEAARPGAR